jgi:hypothetical protein
MDTTTQLRTASGEYVIFHSSQAAQPDVFEDVEADPERGPGWYFEPTNYSENTVFSIRHETPEAARVAAEAWEAEEQRDADYEARRIEDINQPWVVLRADRLPREHRGPTPTEDISIRLPARLRSELAALADTHARSLESYVLYTLARHVLEQRKAAGNPLSIYELFAAEALATPAPGEQS